jgi:hypothetical protein
MGKKYPHERNFLDLKANDPRLNRTVPQVQINDKELLQSCKGSASLSSCVGVLRVKPLFLNLMYGFLPSWMPTFVISLARQRVIRVGEPG